MNDYIDFDFLSKIKQYNKLRRFNSIPLNIDYERILKSRYNKISRIKKRFIYLYLRKKYTYFLTFTLDNELFKKCERTKRDTIKDCLNKFDSKSFYILNVDYGSQTDRQHFHCIYGTNNSSNLLDFLHKNYPCFVWVGRVRNTNDDLKRISKYINKLSNHTAKDSTYNKRVVFNFKGYDNLDKLLAKYVYILDKSKVGL